MTATAAALDFLAIRIAGGARVCTPPSFQRMTTYVLLEQEDWFEPELPFLRELARPGMTVLDIGANFGVFALSLAKAVGPEGEVFAFEPSATTASYLRVSNAENGFEHLRLFQLALSNRVGSAVLSGGAPELKAISFDPACAPEGARVNVMTLDDWAAERTIGSIDIVKLDAEGEEANIIEGGAGVFGALSPVVMLEIKHGSVSEFGGVRALQKHGYKPYRLLPGIGVLAPVDDAVVTGERKLDSYQLNLFCIKDDRADALAAEKRLAKAIAAPPSAPESERWLSKRPYYAQFRKSIEKRQRARGALPRAREHLDAIAHFRQACDKAVNPSLRCSHLAVAASKTAAAAAAHRSAPRLWTATRILAAFGARSLAASLASELQTQALAGFQSPDEPFLAPSRRLETIALKDKNEWMSVASLETFVLLAGFSSYFVGAKMLPLLERGSSSVHASPELERRKILTQLKSGAPAEPPSDRLAIEAPDHQNAALWTPECMERWRQ